MATDKELFESEEHHESYKKATIGCLSGCFLVLALGFGLVMWFLFF